jgi:hypothetical protein
VRRAGPLGAAPPAVLPAGRALLEERGDPFIGVAQFHQLAEVGPIERRQAPLQFGGQRPAPVAGDEAQDGARLRADVLVEQALDRPRPGNRRRTGR